MPIDDALGDLETDHLKLTTEDTIEQFIMYLPEGFYRNFLEKDNIKKIVSIVDELIKETNFDTVEYVNLDTKYSELISNFNFLYRNCIKDLKLGKTESSKTASEKYGSELLKYKQEIHDMVNPLYIKFLEKGYTYKDIK
jgi:hypothetical protein